MATIMSKEEIAKIPSIIKQVERIIEQDSSHIIMLYEWEIILKALKGWI